MPEPLTVTEDQVRALRVALDALLPDERITQLTDERDRARRIAVALEQENAELTRQRDRIANDVVAALPSRADVLREAAALVARFTGNDLDANAKMLRRAAEQAAK
ncbi:hypothetical protein [Streptomyces albidoflavus]|uniref:hypothetical protein n=1 Tax=Streptomyces albidoflavus TaxID=1886 RepID=UPI0033DF826D